MSPLEATVEIIKALSVNQTSGPMIYVTKQDHRQELIQGIEDIYNKIKELEQKQDS